MSVVEDVKLPARFFGAVARTLDHASGGRKRYLRNDGRGDRRKSHPQAKVGGELCHGFGRAGAVVADAAGCASFRPADDVQSL